MEERLKILNLLEEGKITADEAAKLLEALSPIHHFKTDEECCPPEPPEVVEEPENLD